MRAGTVAIVGVGTIGTGWAIVFARKGWRVQLYDLSSAQAQRSVVAVKRAMHTGASAEKPALTGECVRADTLEHTLEGADFVQESAPDDLTLKRELLGAIAARLPRSVPIASSTSAFRPSELLGSEHERRRLLVGHPFHPVDLIPLVEVVGSPQTHEEILSHSTWLYESLGKVVIRLRQECPGHLVNRLQAALFREAIHLVQQGIVTVQDVDRGIAYGPALRWPLSGVFATWHLAGGHGGIHDYMEKLGPSIELLWRSLGDARLSQDVRAIVEQQVTAGCGGRTPEQMSVMRDRLLIELMAWLAARERLI